MKKILVMSPTAGQFFETGSSGGAEKGLIDIFENWNCKTTFCMIGNRNYDSKYKKINLIFSKDKINYYFTLFNQIFKHDIFVSRGFSRSSPIFYVLAKFLGKKTVYFIASDADINIGAKYMPDYHVFVAHKIFYFSDIIITQTQHQKLICEKKYKNKNIIYLKKSIKIIDDKARFSRNYILWVGRDDKVKGIDILKKLTRDLSDCHFVVVGLKEKIANDNVTNLGRVKSRDLKKLYKSAKMVLWTSHISGIPYVFLESLAEKTPVISYKYDTESFLKDSGGGFCANGNYRILKNKTKYFYNNSKITEIMGGSGFNYIKNNNDLNEYIYNLRKIFNN